MSVHPVKEAEEGDESTRAGVSAGNEASILRKRASAPHYWTISPPPKYIFRMVIFKLSTW